MPLASVSRFVAAVGFALTLVASGAGCIGVRGGNARTFDQFPPAHWARSDGTARSMGLVVLYQSGEAGVTNAARQSAGDRITGIGQDVLDDSAYFRNAVDPSSSDFTIAVNVRERLQPRWALAVISGMTLTLIPWWTTVDYTVRAELKSRSGSVLGHRVIKQELTTVVQLFLLFGMPFASPTSVADDMWREAFVDLVDWSHELVEKAAPRPEGRHTARR